MSVELVGDNQEIIDLAVKQPFQLKPPTLNFQTMTETRQTQVPNPPGRSEVQLLVQAIPDYEPGKNLTVFINEVDNLLKHLNNRLTPDLEYILNFNIRSKLKGEARDYISNENAIDWVTIRRTLLLRYGDQRSEDILVSALTQCVQQRNETYIEYYSRVVKCHNDLVTNINLHITDPACLNFKKQEYLKLALKTFQTGLLEPYRSYVSHFPIATGEESLQKCKEYDNMRQKWDYAEYLRRPKEFKKPETQNSNNKPSTSNPMQNHFRPVMPSFPPPLPPKPQFFQGQNFQNKPTLPFNKPLFQNNNFKPPFFQPQNTPKQLLPFNQNNNQPFKKLPPPEPMSVQSRVRSQQVQNQRPWFNKPPLNFNNSATQKRPFMVQELLNTQAETPYFEGYNSYYSENSPYPYEYSTQANQEYQECYSESPSEPQIEEIEENVNFQEPASTPPET